MRTSTITILIAIFVTANAAQIDSILYNKVRVSTPATADATFNVYASGLGKWGARHASQVNRHQLHTIIGQNFPVQAGGVTHNLKPFGDFLALKWGTQFEQLKSHKYISGAGGSSWSVLTASIGIRTGETVSMRTAYGWAQAQTKQ